MLSEVGGADMIGIPPSPAHTHQQASATVIIAVLALPDAESVAAVKLLCHTLFLSYMFSTELLALCSTDFPFLLPLLDADQHGPNLGHELGLCH